LKSRPIANFEILMLEKLGGRDAFERIFFKQIGDLRSALVYDWQDVEEPVDYKVGNFLTAID